MLSFKSADECRKFLKENGISQFDIKFCDLIGSWHHITLSANSVDSNIFEKGVGFDSSSIPRFKDVRSGDMAARPDLSSCFIDTSFEIPTLCAIADIVEAGNAAESYSDPRSVLKRALKYLKKSGVGNRFTCAPELEFYIFSEAGFMNDPYGAWFRLSAPGVGRPMGEETMGASQRMAEGRGYLAAHPHDWWQNERAEMAARIAEVGLPIRYHHVEIGAAGQQEIEIGFTDALESADGILLGKYLVRDVAVEHGIEACFMPKPIANAAGNGLHIHFRILKKGKNLFAGEGYGGLSEFGKLFLGGVLKHGRALLAFSSPTTNSYRRLKTGHETPTRFFYSVGNREAAIRIPKYSIGKNTRCEFRSGDPMMNPYLTIASILMAGIDGVKNKINPVPLNLGPFDGIPPEIDREKYPECFLPEDLSEALNSLQKDQAFLSEGKVFDKKMIEDYISYKRDEEITPLSQTPHPLEYEMYWGI